MWVAHVKEMVPPFDVVYSNNPLVKRLFKEAGVEVKGTHMYNRIEYQGTEIRKKMINGDDWKKYVPKAVAEVIEAIDGINRIREIVGKDV